MYGLQRDAASFRTGSCPTGSTTMVCMTPSFKEGKDGQWYILSNVTVSTNTSASSTPYKVDIIATDKTGKVSRGSVEVTVRDASGYTVDSVAPMMVAAVGTAPGKVEVHRFFIAPPYSQWLSEQSSLVGDMELFTPEVGKTCTERVALVCQDGAIGAI